MEKWINVVQKVSYTLFQSFENFNKHFKLSFTAPLILYLVCNFVNSEHFVTFVLKTCKRLCITNILHLTNTII